MRGEDACGTNEEHSSLADIQVQYHLEEVVRRLVLFVAVALLSFSTLFAAPASAQSGPTLVANSDKIASAGATGSAENAGARDKAQPANASESPAVVEQTPAPLNTAGSCYRTSGWARKSRCWASAS
jgi:hypothetical protein